VHALLPAPAKDWRKPPSAFLMRNLLDVKEIAAKQEQNKFNKDPIKNVHL
jgi:hypothetical protein